MQKKIYQKNQFYFTSLHFSVLISVISYLSLAVLRSRAAGSVRCCPPERIRFSRAVSDPCLYPVGPAASKHAASGRGSKGAPQAGIPPVSHKLYFTEVVLLN